MTEFDDDLDLDDEGFDWDDPDDWDDDDEIFLEELEELENKKFVKSFIAGKADADFDYDYDRDDYPYGYGVD